MVNELNRIMQNRKGKFMQKRNSSIEMVRIIAMVFIIMGHLAAHGVLKVTAADSFEIWRGGGNIQ